MPTSRTRLQVILSKDPAATVKALAEERGLSVSAMCSQLIHAALELPQFQPKPDLSVVKGEAIKTAIEGGNLNDKKLVALLNLVEELSKNS